MAFTEGDAAGAHLRRQNNLDLTKAPGPAAPSEAAADRLAFLERQYKGLEESNREMLQARNRELEERNRELSLRAENLTRGLDAARKGQELQEVLRPRRPSRAGSTLFLDSRPTGPQAVPLTI